MAQSDNSEDEDNNIFYSYSEGQQVWVLNGKKQQWLAEIIELEETRVKVKWTDTLDIEWTPRNMLRKPILEENPRKRTRRTPEQAQAALDKRVRREVGPAGERDEEEQWYQQQRDATISNYGQSRKNKRQKKVTPLPRQQYDESSPEMKKVPGKKKANKFRRTSVVADGALNASSKSDQKQNSSEDQSTTERSLVRGFGHRVKRLARKSMSIESLCERGNLRCFLGRNIRRTRGKSRIGMKACWGLPHDNTRTSLLLIEGLEESNLRLSVKGFFVDFRRPSQSLLQVSFRTRSGKFYFDYIRRAWEGEEEEEWEELPLNFEKPSNMEENVEVVDLIEKKEVEMIDLLDSP